jgi:cell division control protein 45
LGEILGFDVGEGEMGGMGDVEVWVIDARRPWNLVNVFGGGTDQSPLTDLGANQREGVPGVERGRISKAYRPGRGGIIVFDDGDIDEELTVEREAYCALEDMPELDDDGKETDDSESGTDSDEGSSPGPKKRKSWSGRDEGDGSEEEDERPRQRRRSNSVR